MIDHLSKLTVHCQTIYTVRTHEVIENHPMADSFAFRQYDGASIQATFADGVCALSRKLSGIPPVVSRDGSGLF